MGVIKQSILWVLVVFFLLPQVPAFAVADYGFYQKNEIIFYDPNAIKLSCNMGTAGAVTDSADNAEAIFKYLISTNFSSLGGKPMNAVQAAAFLGNIYQESGYDPSIIQGGKAYDDQKARSSVGGYAFGIVQWDSGRRWNNKGTGLLNVADLQKKSWSDLVFQLDFLKGELEGSEKAIMQDNQFLTTSDVATATVRVRTVFERAGTPNDTRRIQAANEAYAKYQNLAPGTINASTGACALSTSTSNGNGDIAATAIALSWSKRVSEGATDHSVLEPKKEYRDALISTGVNKLGDKCSMAGNSCDAFLATVMRFSGADPKFPCCGSSAQNAYMKSHPELYEVISTHVTNTANLAAGDLMWRNGHVKVYIGKGREAAASHCERTAEQSRLYLDGNYTAYRLKTTVGV